MSEGRFDVVDERARLDTLTIQVTLRNAAFEPDHRYDELKRCLKKVAYKVDDELTTGREGTSGKILDSNGNTVGHWALTAEG